MAASGGWEVRDASTVEEAIAALEAEMPHLVLLDVRMPDVVGPAGLAAVRGVSGNVPVLLMSGFVEPAVQPMLDALGHSGVLRKPFGPDALLEAMEGVRRHHD